MGCVVGYRQTEPQGLKPQALYAYMARLKSCPFKSSMLINFTPVLPSVIHDAA